MFGFDFNDIFSPVVKVTNIKIIFALVCTRIDQLGKLKSIMLSYMFT